MEDIADQGDADGDDLVAEDNHERTEALKRKERRHAKKARDREGDRRRNEGKRRNYLLVDQYTGQINKQSVDAVKEISVWIQETWDYSFPIKFEIVKEVIARGVSLQRAELWRRIRANEPKPQDVTDRAWRSLKKELGNPATIRKSMLCSKANAARINFGRTGPSGEVGLRESLRRQLRRSPHPEEISTEMARDKGYAGHSKRQAVEALEDTVMHGTGRTSPLFAKLGKTTDGYGSAYEDDIAETGDGEHEVAESQELQLGRGGDGRAATGSVSSQRLPNVIDDPICTNPFMLTLLDRLANLEETLKTKSARVSAMKAAMTSGKVSECGKELESEVEVMPAEVDIHCEEGMDAEPENPPVTAKETREVYSFQDQGMQKSTGPNNPEEVQGHDVQSSGSPENSEQDVQSSGSPENSEQVTVNTDSKIKEVGTGEEGSPGLKKLRGFRKRVKRI